MLLNLIIVGMFGAEMCSPFMLGYFNQKEKQIRANKLYIEKREKEKKIQEKLMNVCDWKKIDYSDCSFSDSKSLRIKE